MEECDYDAAAGTIKIEDIACDAINQDILRRLKENDPNFDKLLVVSTRHINESRVYCPENARELGWLGYYIGRNTILKQLNF